MHLINQVRRYRIRIRKFNYVYSGKVMKIGSYGILISYFFIEIRRFFLKIKILIFLSPIQEVSEGKILEIDKMCENKVKAIKNQ